MQANEIPTRYLDSFSLIFFLSDKILFSEKLFYVFLFLFIIFIKSVIDNVHFRSQFDEQKELGQSSANLTCNH